LEVLWVELRGASPSQRIGLCYRLASGLAFCHEKGVFHRNVCADAVLVTRDLEDLRLTSFEMARDLELTSTVPDQKLSARDPRVIPPEELGRRVPGNARLGDVFQLGVLFYRIMENGLWPYDDPLAYATDACGVRPMTWWLSQEGDRNAPDLVAQMLSVDPTRRPDPLQRVEAALRSIAGS
jgi:serine/threonine protein kinase